MSAKRIVIVFRTSGAGFCLADTPGHLNVLGLLNSAAIPPTHAASAGRGGFQVCQRLRDVELHVNCDMSLVCSQEAVPVALQPKTPASSRRLLLAADGQAPV